MNPQVQYFIREGENIENRIIIPQYNPISQEMANAKRDYAAELKEENASFEFADREFEILILHAGGFTSKQIAQMLCRSPKTIEEYIVRARNKIGCSDRASAHRYVLEHNWGYLIQFFFPYMPDTVH